MAWVVHAMSLSLLLLLLPLLLLLLSLHDVIAAIRSWLLRVPSTFPIHSMHSVHSIHPARLI